MRDLGAVVDWDYLWSLVVAKLIFDVTNAHTLTHYKSHNALHPKSAVTLWLVHVDLLFVLGLIFKKIGFDRWHGLEFSSKQTCKLACSSEKGCS